MDSSLRAVRDGAVTEIALDRIVVDDVLELARGGGRGAGRHRRAHPAQRRPWASARPAQLTYNWPSDPSAIAIFVSPVAAGPTSTAPVLALNCEPWHGQMITCADGS
jgi:hypothetical protein